MGITGTRDAVSAHAGGLVQRIRPHTDLPVAVGLGVSNGTQAAQVAAFADGVIVGSAFVRRLLDAADAADAGNAADPAAGTGAIAELAAELSAAIRRPAHS
jgi:tryptophan synthase alpha chain